MLFKETRGGKVLLHAKLRLQKIRYMRKSGYKSFVKCKTRGGKVLLHEKLVLQKFRFMRNLGWKSFVTCETRVAKVSLHAKLGVEKFRYMRNSGWKSFVTCKTCGGIVSQLGLQKFRYMWNSGCKSYVTCETQDGKVSLHAKLGVEIAKTNSVLAAAANRAARLAHPLFPNKLRPKVQTFISRRCSRENPRNALQLSCWCGNWKIFSFWFCLGSVLHEGFSQSKV